MLSNSAISETSAPATKDIPESADVNFKTGTDSDVPQKVSAIQCADEKPQLSAPMDAKVSETVVAAEPETVDTFSVDEATVIFIQATIRGFLVPISFHMVLSFITKKSSKVYSNFSYCNLLGRLTRHS